MNDLSLQAIRAKLLGDEWTDQIRDAEAKLAALRANLAELKKVEGRLEKNCQEKTAAQEALVNKLDATLAESERVQLQRKDIEFLIYSDAGLSTWEEEFHRHWKPDEFVPAVCDEVTDEMEEMGSIEARRALGAKVGMASVRRLRTEALLLGSSSSYLAAELDGHALLLGEQPLCAWIPNFATAEECRALVDLGFRKARPHNENAQKMQRTKDQLLNASQEGVQPLRGVATASLDVADQTESDRLLLERMQHRVAALTGIPVHGNEMNPFLKFDRPGERVMTTSGDDLSIGIHLDTNGGSVHCVCSVIVYLNCCEGGRTVFPAFADARSQELGTVLSGAGLTHTSSSSVEDMGMADIAAELVARGQSEDGALRVSPQSGAAFVFFTLLGEERPPEEQTAGGKAALAPPPDPYAWHGGAAVHGVLGKWTLQIFKEVPLEIREEGPAAEAHYVSRLRSRIVEAAGEFLNRVEAVDLSSMD